MNTVGPHTSTTHRRWRTESRRQPFRRLAVARVRPQRRVFVLWKLRSSMRSACLIAMGGGGPCQPDLAQLGACLLDTKGNAEAARYTRDCTVHSVVEQ